MKIKYASLTLLVLALVLTLTLILPGAISSLSIKSNASAPGDGEPIPETNESSTKEIEVQESDLPNVAILATGGTIAGSGTSSTNTTDYKPGEIGVQTLIDAVPEMTEIANISGEQVANVGSSEITSDILLDLGKKINELLAGDEIDGVVVTHGTDTLEETAYFLNLVVKSDKPVVVVGSMRPATATSTDGPLNLYNAVLLASSQEAIGQGVMVSLNDRIGAARYITKTNTTNVDTFQSAEEAYLGRIVGGVPHFYNKSTREHTTETVFDISDLEELPQVDIVYSYQDNQSYMIEAAVEQKADGIVIAGSGNGSLSKEYEKSAEKAIEEGTEVAVSSRVGGGTVSPKENFITSDSLNPQKARILLMLALSETEDDDTIQSYFDNY